MTLTPHPLAERTPTGSMPTSVPPSLPPPSFPPSLPHYSSPLCPSFTACRCATVSVGADTDASVFGTCRRARGVAARQKQEGGFYSLPFFSFFLMCSEKTGATCSVSQ